MNYTAEEILSYAKNQGVHFVRLQFTDIFGVLKNVAISSNLLGKALQGEMMFDGSSIDGFVRIEESDMYLRPDLSSWNIFPWKMGNHGAVARLICDVYNPDGTPFHGDPRNILKKQLQKALDMGYTMNVGPEAEFFMFHTDEEGKPTLKTHDRASYFDLAPVDLGEEARRDMVLTLEEMGFEIEACHHEVAPGQHEIDFKYADALHAADHVQTFKLVVRTIAQQHGLHATFMPKPIYGIAGSGMHVNQSLFKDGKNAFYDIAGKDQLSKEAYWYIGGLLKHAKAISAITNPTVNSYKRLVPDYEAPVYIAWSEKNRSPLIRIPAKRGSSTRVELRNPDPTCNPYLAFAVMLAAGLDGIANQIEPPAAIDTNIYTMSAEEKKKNGLQTLPSSLKEALEELAKDEVIQEAIGPHIYQRLLAAKKLEWNEYRQQVSPWEVEHYLAKY